MQNDSETPLCSKVGIICDIQGCLSGILHQIYFLSLQVILEKFCICMHKGMVSRCLCGLGVRVILTLKKIFKQCSFCFSLFCTNLRSLGVNSLNTGQNYENYVLNISDPEFYFSFFFFVLGESIDHIYLYITYSLNSLSELD